MFNHWLLEDLKEQFPVGTKVKVISGDVLYTPTNTVVDLTGIQGTVLDVWYYHDRSEYFVDVKFDATPPGYTNPEDQDASLLPHQIEVI